VGNLVVFTPCNANAVGVYDVISRSFDASVSTGSLTMGWKFDGAVAVGNLVIFVPQSAGIVGVYDVISRSFDATVSTGSRFGQVRASSRKDNTVP
jgi:hypothetical protein